MLIQPDESFNLLKDIEFVNKRNFESHYLSDKRSLIEVLNFYKFKIFGNKRFYLNNSKLFQLLSKFHVGGKKLNDVFINPNQEKILRNIFKEENKSLSKRYKLKLDLYDYYI